MTVRRRRSTSRRSRRYRRRSQYWPGFRVRFRDLEADLGRLSGRLSHLFTLNYARASLHREEIHQTLYAVQDVMRRVQPEIAAMSAAVAEPRTQIATVMRAIARELKGGE